MNKILVGSTAEFTYTDNKMFGGSNKIFGRFNQKIYVKRTKFV